MAELFQADGTKSQHVPSQPPEWSLQELQFLVGGYIEKVYVRPGSPAEGALAFCDEDGRAKRLPLNATASWLVGYEYRGPVLLFGKGETVA